MSSTQAKANIAATQALQAGASPRDLDIARQFLGTKKFIGYCQSFVRQVTGGKTTGASAIQAWNRAPQKVQGTQGIKPGDLVYFSPNTSNRGYGHTGIYAGNGQFISATNSGIKQTNVLDWMKTTGQRLLGYVPGSGSIGAGQQVQPQNQLLARQPLTPQQAISHSVQMRSSGLTSQIPIPTLPTDMIQQRRPVINLDPNQNIAQNA